MPTASAMPRSRPQSIHSDRSAGGRAPALPSHDTSAIRLTEAQLRPTRAAATITAVAYLRRSSDRQEQSLADQRTAITRYATQAGLRIVREYVDDAISGADSVKRRAFQQMMQDAQAPRRDFRLVLVFDVSRFGRIDNDEAGHYRWLLRQAGIEVKYVAEGLLGGALDDLIRPVKQWHAREELRQLSLVTIRGMVSCWERSVGRGQWLGGFPPQGYDLRHEDLSGKHRFTIRYMPDGTKQVRSPHGRVVQVLARRVAMPEMFGSIVRLTPSAAERVRTVRMIFSMRAREGRSAYEIATHLQRDKVPTARGPEWSRRCGGIWREVTILKILSNPVYAGDLVWNRRTMGRFHRISDGRAIVRDDATLRRTAINPEEDWIIVRDAHEPLVNRELWVQAQSSAKKTNRSANTRGDTA